MNDEMKLKIYQSVLVTDKEYVGIILFITTFFFLFELFGRLNFPATPFICLIISILFIIALFVALFYDQEQVYRKKLKLLCEK